MQIDLGEVDKAIQILDSAKLINGSERNKGICFNNLGYCYHEKEDYPKALENYLMAIRFFRESNDTNQMAKSYLNSATCLKSIGVYDKAVEYAQLAYQITKT